MSAIAARRSHDANIGGRVLKLLGFKWEIGGREGIRTLGLLVANEALSQLSYSPTSSNKILADAAHLANQASLARKQKGAQHAAPLIFKSNGFDSYGWSVAPLVRWAVILFAF
jgi:hypothetical protein